MAIDTEERLVWINGFTPTFLVKTFDPFQCTHHVHTPTVVVTIIISMQ